MSRPPPLPTRATEARQARLRSLARLLDDSIPLPGTRRHIGIDPLLGLLPGVGDLAGAALSGYILLEAARLGVSRATLLRMGANVGVDAVVGAFPFLGDLFDAGWKANARNVRLLDRHLADPGRAARASRGWLVAVLGGVAVVAVGAGALAVWAVLALVRALGG